MHNLVKNAIEAMPGDELSAMNIHTYTCQLANTKYAGIKIIDNGPGIPQKLMARIFDPYMTTKIKGNGLGLAIVKKIIEEHNGHIQIENAEGSGATVNIRFPLYSQTVKSRDNIEDDSE
jgi:nitrogen fixation/metabolism regulation signal transduction histidine kinase